MRGERLNPSTTRTVHDPVPVHPRLTSSVITVLRMTPVMKDSRIILSSTSWMVVKTRAALPMVLRKLVMKASSPVLPARRMVTIWLTRAITSITVLEA